MWATFLASRVRGSLGAEMVDSSTFHVMSFRCRPLLNWDDNNRSCIHDSCRWWQGLRTVSRWWEHVAKTTVYTEIACTVGIVLLISIVVFIYFPYEDETRCRAQGHETSNATQDHRCANHHGHGQSCGISWGVALRGWIAGLCIGRSYLPLSQHILPTS